MTILVTGGTGLLGRHVVTRLRAADRAVRVLSRTPDTSEDGVDRVAVDLLEGTGIEQAMHGVETVVHLAGGAKGDDDATRNLVEAARRADVRHLVYISVIGADAVPVAWVRSKYAAERAVAESGIAWSTLRAAQFHDLVYTVVQKMAKLPVVPVPGGLRFQSVDVREVADRMVGLALGEPAGLVRDLAGPAEYDMSDLVRSYLRASGKHRLTMPVRMPGKVGRAYRAGDNLSLQDVDRGERTWEEFLAGRLERAADRVGNDASTELA